MTTAAERLVLLAGTGGTAGALLLLIGSGATAGAVLVDYSGLPSATAGVHLMTDVSVETPSGGPGFRLPRPDRFAVDAPPKRRPKDEELLFMLDMA